MSDARAEWVRQAIAARVEQGLPPSVEDPAVVGFIAELFLRRREAPYAGQPPETEGPTTVIRKPPPPRKAVSRGNRR